MKKKITIIVVLVALIIFGLLCFILKPKENSKTQANETKNKTSSEIFKEKYESINKQTNNENNKNEVNNENDETTVNLANNKELKTIVSEFKVESAQYTTEDSHVKVKK